MRCPLSVPEFTLTLWRAPSFHKMTLPKVLICGKSLFAPFVLPITIIAGAITWAHKDVQGMLGPIAEVVVRSDRQYQASFH